VAQYAIDLYQQLGGKVVCVSSWDQGDQTTYAFAKPDGIDLDQLRGITDRFGGIDKARAADLGYEVVPGDQTPSFRGPHNIIRRVVEFAFEHPDVAVFLGTPTEILATLVSLAKAESPATALAFCEDASALPVWQRAAAASDASDLVGQASALGLQVSERTAHRILSGSLAPLERVTDEATVEEPETETPVDIYRDRRSVRIHSDDLDDFKRGLLDAFDTLSERYYLNVKGEPRVTVSKDEIRVRFQIDKDD
jgi:hypothetical protein